VHRPLFVSHNSPKRPRLAALGLAFASAIVIAACGGALPADDTSANSSTPLALAQSWFKSINGKDLNAAQGDFVPSERSMMDWGGGDSATWSTFTKLRCRTLQNSGKAATVHCTFNESQSSSEGNPDSFWTISMERTPAGNWLIDNYGQG
jgi:hypothetical protein